MALKIFKGIWFFSVVGLLLTFFYVYAGLPEWVTLSEEGAVPSIPKNSLFYFSLSLMAVINTLVFVVTRLPIKQKPDFKAWFYGLIITVNLFFISSLGFLHVYNSGERYDYTSMAPAIYGSLFLVSAWIISWPIYVLSQKILAK